jgi:hypothetical protein
LHVTSCSARRCSPISYRDKRSPWYSTCSKVDIKKNETRLFRLPSSPILLDSSQITHHLISPWDISTYK